MFGLILMTFGFGWAVVGIISVLLTGESALVPFIPAGESLLQTFVILSYFILYWVPGILVGMIGAVMRWQSPRSREV